MELGCASGATGDSFRQRERSRLPVPLNYETFLSWSSFEDFPSPRAMEPGESAESRRVLLEKVYSVLKRHGFDEKARVEIWRGTRRGDHYMSVIRKIKAIQKSSDGPGKEFFLLAKCIPTNQQWKDTFNIDDHFQKEVNFYTEVLPFLRDFRKRHRVSSVADDDPNIFPECYAAICNGKEDFILMEDLSEAGFTMGDKKDGLCFEDALIVVRSMGWFHAQSYAISEKEPLLVEKLKSVAFEAFITRSNTFKYGRSFGQQVRSATEGVRRCCPDSAEKLDALLGKDVYERMVELAQDCHSLPVVNFGDCWTNNLFFRRLPDGKPKGVRFIDFQLTRFASPVLDLSYFFFTSINMHDREEHMTTLLKEYHSSLERSLQNLSCKVPMTFQDLENQMKKYAVFGLYMGLILVPLYHVDNKEAPDVETAKDDAMDTMVRFHLKVMENEVVQQKVTSLVKQCIQQGYI